MYFVLESGRTARDIRPQLMNDFIRQSTPLALALCLGMVGVTAVLISKGATILSEADFGKRRQLAWAVLVSALPANLCRSSFSFDIWVITALFAGDNKTLAFYNITDKQSAVQLLIVLHLILFLFVASWGGLVRRGDTVEGVGLEVFVALAAVLLCIAFQVY